MQAHIDGSLTDSLRLQMFRSGTGTTLGAWPFQMLRAFVFFLYANLALWVPAAESVRPAQLVILVGFVLLLVEGAVSRRGLTLVWPLSHLLLAFLAAAVLSSFTALWGRLAFDSALDLAKCVAVFFLITETVNHPSRLRSLLWMMVLGGFFPAAGTLLNWESGSTEEGRAGWLGIFGNPNDVAYSLVILIPLAWGLAALSDVRGKIVAGVAIVVYSAAIYTTFSRGGLLAFAAVLVALALRARSQATRLAVLMLVPLALVGSTYFWTRTQGSFDALGTDATVNQRLITVKAGLAMLADHPLLGVGLGCSIVGFETYVPYGALTHKALIVHNTFVQALAEVGLLGGIPFLLLMYTSWSAAHGMARAPRTDDVGRERAIVGTALEASLIGVAVCGLSSGQVMSWFPYMLFGLVAAERRLAVTAPQPAAAEAA
jgi:O-antigen ligase